MVLQASQHSTEMRHPKGFQHYTPLPEVHECLSLAPPTLAVAALLDNSVFAAQLPSGCEPPVPKGGCSHLHTHTAELLTCKVCAAAFPTDFRQTHEYLEQLEIRTLPGTGLDPGQELFISKCSKKKFRAHETKCQPCKNLRLKEHFTRFCWGTSYCSFLGIPCVASHIWLLDLSHLCINIRSFQDVLNFIFTVSVTASCAV